ncbi:hypothetical protein EHQ16_03435 [Leptospira kanakyensis]|uniref:Uncharacterized protein n=1 Tax=Leptospira kanakyensis TaxID=2484968 RepID=A0A6N4PUM0_9LEPT|nr:hypothetical protein [Leptospira kanakyensis]TGK47480.1 hypothetical protein EHQ11_16195 [Leptospira kanakyensis]TGK63517.1 hypothetical protein EHQ16_03435 [Leptospira kanakyensis]TGK67121.1 hypothetical protein EHQ18_18675 [Leptospira kanakyensis]
MISLSSILAVLFLVLGLILSLYGVWTWSDPMYEKSLGWNLNLVWGGVVFFVGILFGLGNRISTRFPKEPNL